MKCSKCKKNYLKFEIIVDDLGNYTCLDCHDKITKAMKKNLTFAYIVYFLAVLFIIGSCIFFFPLMAEDFKFTLDFWGF